jgi:hypothetical protein
MEAILTREMGRFEGEFVLLTRCHAEDKTRELSILEKCGSGDLYTAVSTNIEGLLLSPCSGDKQQEKEQDKALPLPPWDWLIMPRVHDQGALLDSKLRLALKTLWRIEHPGLPNQYIKYMSEHPETKFEWWPDDMPLSAKRTNTEAARLYAIAGRKLYLLLSPGGSENEVVVVNGTAEAKALEERMERMERMDRMEALEALEALEEQDNGNAVGENEGVVDNGDGCGSGSGQDVEAEDIVVTGPTVELCHKFGCTNQRHHRGKCTNTHALKKFQGLLIMTLHQDDPFMSRAMMDPQMIARLHSRLAENANDRLEAYGSLQLPITPALREWFTSGEGDAAYTKISETYPGYMEKLIDHHQALGSAVLAIEEARRRHERKAVRDAARANQIQIKRALANRKKRSSKRLKHGIHHRGTMFK